MAAKDPREREFPRYEVSAYVDYTGSEVLLYHRIQNISLGGICIHSEVVEDVGAIVDLKITFPALDGAHIELRGAVVWVNRAPPAEMGIRFLDLDEQRRDLLRQYLGRAAG